jgi:hypothetical protein
MHALGTIAGRLGFDLQPAVSLADIGDRRHLPILRDCHGVSDRMASNDHGLSVEIMDVHTPVTVTDEQGSQSQSTLSRTIVVIPVRTTLPDFQLDALNALTRSVFRVMGFAGVRLSAEPGSEDACVADEFARLYRLQLANEAWLNDGAEPRLEEKVRHAVLQTFTPDVLARLTSEPGWNLQAARGYLALWRNDHRALTAEERPQLVSEALGVFEVLNRAPAPTKPRLTLTVRPPQTLNAQFRRFLAIMLGAVVGFAVGVLAGWLLLRTVGVIGGPLLSFCLDGLLALGGMVLGILLALRWFGFDRVDEDRPGS